MRPARAAFDKIVPRQRPAKPVNIQDSGNRRTDPRHIQQRQQAGAVQTLRVARGRGRSSARQRMQCGSLLSLRERRTESVKGACEISILAGGSSSRMGRNKASLRLGRRTLLGHVRACARNSGLPHRVIRRDLLPGCGPLGGVYTALATSRAQIIVFLSCDMPFISADLV